jgi:Trk K+ transport system NAD-binding subunit
MTTPPPKRRAVRPRRRYRFGRLVRANLYDLGLLLNESWIVLAGFLIVTLIGTIYLHVIYNPCAYIPGAMAECRLGLIEALYETIKLQTLQSSLAFPNDSVLGEILFFFIPMLGLALIFQGVLNFGRLLLDKGSRREAWQIALAATYHDHVIVCGLGRVGMRTVQQLLDAGHEPVVIEADWNSEFVVQAVNDKVPVVIGDAREPLTLRRAGLMRARAIISAINDDLLNVEISLTARTLRPKMRVVLRVFGDELDRNLERSLGRNAAFSASALAAPTFAVASVIRGIEYVLPLEGGPLGITQLTITADSKLNGFVRSVEEQGEFRLLHHEMPDGRRILPGAMSQLSGGDRVMVIGNLAALEAIRRNNLAGTKLDFLRANVLPQPTEPFNTVLVCGLGKVGYRVVRQLHAMNPRPQIVVVRLNDGRPDFPQRIAELDGVRFVIGDAREIDVLREAGIEHAFSIAALTSDDLLNLEISLNARRIRPDVHIVLRVFSDALAEKLGDMFGIQTAYSTPALASPTLAAAALVGDVAHGLIAGGRLHTVEQITVQAGSSLIGATVDWVRLRLGKIVLDLRRGAILMTLPALQTVLLEDDMLTILGPIEPLKPRKNKK